MSGESGQVPMIGRGLSMGTRGEDADAWCDVYAGKRPPTPTIMVHNTFLSRLKPTTTMRVGGCIDCIDNNASWRYDGKKLRLTAAGTEYIYRLTGWGTAGGFTEYGWPD